MPTDRNGLFSAFKISSMTAYLYSLDTSQDLRSTVYHTNCLTLFCFKTTAGLLADDTAEGGSCSSHLEMKYHTATTWAWEKS